MDDVTRQVKKETVLKNQSLELYSHCIVNWAELVNVKVFDIDIIMTALENCKGGFIWKGKENFKGTEPSV